MERRQLEIIKAKQLRGEILRILHEFLGESVEINTIKNLLRYKGYNSDRDFIKAIDYLCGADTEEDKKYVIMPDESKIKITQVGVNLFEGDMKDLGVLFNE